MAEWGAAMPFDLTILDALDQLPERGLRRYGDLRFALPEVRSLRQIGARVLSVNVEGIFEWRPDGSLVRAVLFARGFPNYNTQTITPEGDVLFEAEGALYAWLDAEARVELLWRLEGEAKLSFTADGEHITCRRDSGAVEVLRARDGAPAGAAYASTEGWTELSKDGKRMLFAHEFCAQSGSDVLHFSVRDLTTGEVIGGDSRTCYMEIVRLTDDGEGVLFGEEGARAKGRYDLKTGEWKRSRAMMSASGPKQLGARRAELGLPAVHKVEHILTADGAVWTERWRYAEETTELPPPTSSVQAMCLREGTLFRLNADGKVQTWRGRGGMLKPELKPHPDRGAFSPDGGLLVQIGYTLDPGGAWVRELAPGLPLHSRAEPTKGRKWATAVAGEVLYAGLYGALARWDLHSGEVLPELSLDGWPEGPNEKTIDHLRAHGRSLAALAESPFTKAGAVFLLHEDHILQRLFFTAPRPLCVALDERHLAIGLRDGSLQVWRREPWSLAHTLRGHLGAVTALHLDGDRLYSGARDGTVVCWQL